MARLRSPDTRELETRDAALRRLARVSRWLIAGSVTLTGVLAEVAAHAFPGRTAGTAQAKGAAGTRSSQGEARTTTRAASQPLQGPAQTPQAASTQPSQTEAEPSQAGEATHTEETAPSQESTQSQETRSQESAPVVSGGS